MKVLSLKLYTFFFIMISTAVVFALYTFLRDDFFSLNVSAIIAWSLIALISESFSVYYLNGSFFVSPIEAVFCGCYLTCGPLGAGLCIFITFLCIVTKDENKYWHIFNTAPRYVIFNIIHHFIVMLTINQIYLFLKSHLVNMHIIPAIIIAPLFFSLSCAFNALFYKLEDGELFVKSLAEIFSPYYQTAFPASLAAVLIAFAYRRYGMFAFLIMLTPLLVTFLTMRNQARGKN